MRAGQPSLFNNDMALLNHIMLLKKQDRWNGVVLWVLTLCTLVAVPIVLTMS